MSYGFRLGVARGAIEKFGRVRENVRASAEIIASYNKAVALRARAWIETFGDAAKESRGDSRPPREGVD